MPRKLRKKLAGVKMTAYARKGSSVENFVLSFYS